jgi:hypothetical protein
MKIGKKAQSVRIICNTKVKRRVNGNFLINEMKTECVYHSLQDLWSSSFFIFIYLPTIGLLPMLSQQAKSSARADAYARAFVSSTEANRRRNFLLLEGFRNSFDSSIEELRGDGDCLAYDINRVAEPLVTGRARQLSFGTTQDGLPTMKVTLTGIRGGRPASQDISEEKSRGVNLADEKVHDDIVANVGDDVGEDDEEAVVAAMYNRPLSNSRALPWRRWQCKASTSTAFRRSRAR